MGRNSLGDDIEAFLGIITNKLVLQVEDIMLFWRIELKISTKQVIAFYSKNLNTLPLNWSGPAHF